MSEISNFNNFGVTTPESGKKQIPIPTAHRVCGFRALATFAVLIVCGSDPDCELTQYSDAQKRYDRRRGKKGRADSPTTKSMSAGVATQISKDRSLIDRFALMG